MAGGGLKGKFKHLFGTYPQISLALLASLAQLAIVCTSLSRRLPRDWSKAEAPYQYHYTSATAARMLGMALTSQPPAATVPHKSIIRSNPNTKSDH